MLLNAETDYAIRIVAFLADVNEKRDARSIADGTGVPLRFCIKILNRLVSFDIVKSYKGSKGGYVLARSADEISLFEVVEKVNSGCELIHCQCGESSCTNPGGLCRFMPAFDRAGLRLKEELGKVTFGSEHGKQD